MMQVCGSLFTTTFGYYLLCFAAPEHLYYYSFPDRAEKILCAQALREELGAAERRSEEERAAHNATKKVYSWNLIAEHSKKEVAKYLYSDFE